MDTKSLFPVTREKLYQLVWAEPMVKVAAKYNVSSSYMARICKKMNVPRPSRGYWAKISAGQSPPQKELPEIGPGDIYQWTKWGGSAGFSPVLPPMPKAVINDIPIQLGVYSKSMHSLVQRAKGHFSKSRLTRIGGYLFPSKREAIDLITTECSLIKALSVTNLLYIALESVGYKVMLSADNLALYRHNVSKDDAASLQHIRERLWQPSHPTVVYVGTIAIGLTVIEKTIEPKGFRESYLNPPPFTPSGEFRLIAYCPYWKDKWHYKCRISSKRDLIEKLPEIRREIEGAAIWIEKDLQSYLHNNYISEKAKEGDLRRWKLEKKRERQRVTYQKSREDIYQLIESWSEGQKVQAFFDEVEKSLTLLPYDEKAQLTARLKKAKDITKGMSAIEYLSIWKTPDEH